MATNKLKDHPESGDEGRRAKADAERSDSDNAQQVQDVVDQETQQGFRGVEVDPTPNENYTVDGVTSGAPTPETDEGAAAKAREAQADASRRAAGVAER